MQCFYLPEIIFDGSKQQYSLLRFQFPLKNGQKLLMVQMLSDCTRPMQLHLYTEVLVKMILNLLQQSIKQKREWQKQCLKARENQQKLAVIFGIQPLLPVTCQNKKRLFLLLGPFLIKSMEGTQSKFTQKFIPDLFQTELLIDTLKRTKPPKLQLE